MLHVADKGFILLDIVYGGQRSYLVRYYIWRTKDLFSLWGTGTLSSGWGGGGNSVFASVLKRGLLKWLRGVCKFSPFTENQF